MRILLDLQACQASSMHRGIGRYSMALALAIARNCGGHDVRIVLNEAYPDSVAAIRKAFDSLVAQSQITIFVAPAPVAEVDPRNAWRVRTAERIREHFLAGLRPDIVHVASLFEGLSDNVVASVPQQESRFDTAITLYDLIPLMHKERYLADPNVASWYYRKLEQTKRAGLLLAISGSAREEGIELLQLPAERVVNISSAVDPLFRPRPLAPEVRAALLARHGIGREFIMYTGGIDYRKNIERLVEAYAGLPAALRRQYQLAVVCRMQDPDRLRLERLAARLKLPKDDLVLTGFVSDDDLVSLYNCTSLFVFPSLHEGFGLPALEAMACGAPVIGANTSSIPEVIGRADAMFDPTSVDAISTAMAQVLLDPARQAVLREQGLAQAARFSWDACAQRAIGAFEEIHQRRIRAGSVSVGAASAMAPYKPRLAYVSPLPPTRSSIAAYSASLLPELARHYEIELVLAQDGVDDPALAAFPQRSATWFDANAHMFDHIVYQFGNAASHTHMLALLERHPGVVVLHDFFLGDVISHAEAIHVPAGEYCRYLYLAHGYGALVEEKEQGRTTSCMTYPANKAVLDRATGVIVHSADAVTLATHWYGAGFADDWRVLPPVGLRADEQFAGQASDELGAQHSHVHVAALYRAAIDDFAGGGRSPGHQQLVASIAALGAGALHSDLLQTAAAIAVNKPRTGARQLMIDVSAIDALDAPAERALIQALIARPPAGWRIEPVRHDGVRHRYARRFTLGLIGRPDLLIEDAVAEAGAGDLLLALDDGAGSVLPSRWAARGVSRCRIDAAAALSRNDLIAAILAAAPPCQ